MKRWSSRDAARLLLVLAAAAALSRAGRSEAYDSRALAQDQEADDEAGTEGDPDARLWKEPCDVDGRGHGELFRVSGSTTGANMSSGHETYRVQLGEDVLVELRQEGDLEFGGGATLSEEEQWKVTCSRGAIRIERGGAEVRLSVAGRSASVDAKWLQGLAPERAKELSLERLGGIVTILEAMAEEHAVASRDEALARARLLLAERSVDAGETDQASASLQAARAGRFPALASWARRAGERLATARGASPIVAAKPKRLGTLRGLPSTPPGAFDAGAEGEVGSTPALFWLKSSLCVQQEGDQSNKMRCYDAAAGRWGGVEPYVSPYATAPKLTAAYLGHPGGYATRLVLEEATGERVLGDFHSPTLLARDIRGGVVVRATGLGSCEPESVEVEGYDPARGVGSTLAGGGKFFFDGPTSLRSASQPGRSWSVPTPGTGAGVTCVAAPLSSPDERRAACVASREPGAKAGAGYELWIFELAAAPR